LGMFMNLVKALIFMRMRGVLTGKIAQVLYLATIDFLQLIDFKSVYKSSDLWSTHASNPHEDNLPECFVTGKERKDLS